MIQIKKTSGLDLMYDEQRQRFILVDTDGTEIGYATTQAEAEDKAKKYSKGEQGFKRVAIIGFDYRNKLIKGQLTSVNTEDESAWVSMEGSEGRSSGRQKTDLRFSTRYWEATEKNMELADKIRVKNEVAATLSSEIEALREQFEKPINKAYFGIKER